MPASNDNLPREAPSESEAQTLTPDQQKRRLRDLCDTLPSDGIETAKEQVDRAEWDSGLPVIL